jgi:hypothetical protein
MLVVEVALHTQEVRLVLQPLAVALAQEQPKVQMELQILVAVRVVQEILLVLAQVAVLA